MTSELLRYHNLAIKKTREPLQRKTRLEIERPTDSSVCHVPNRRRQDCLHQTIKYSSVALGHQKAKAPTIGSFDAQ